MVLRALRIPSERSVGRVLDAITAESAVFLVAPRKE
jgi:hypothetical protein